VETENEVFEDDYLFGAVSNSTSLGGLLKLDAQYFDMNDGLFEVLLVKKPYNAAELQKIISGLLTQQFDGKVVKLFSTSKVKFTMQEAIPWSLDGEYDEGAEEIIIENCHDVLDIMI
jgi:diacylglycerol kinase family enzyme